VLRIEDGSVVARYASGEKPGSAVFWAEDIAVWYEPGQIRPLEATVDGEQPWHILATGWLTAPKVVNGSLLVIDRGSNTLLVYKQPPDPPAG
jgi:hypothetical protein